MHDAKSRPTRRDLLRWVALALAGNAGCGYSVRAPYDMSIQTVYVPLFRSISFRREVQLQLTDLVIKVIDKRTEEPAANP